MKKSFFKINNATASQSVAMETETIQKNGASSKSYTNSRKFLSVLAFMLIGFCANVQAFGFDPWGGGRHSSGFSFPMGDQIIIIIGVFLAFIIVRKFLRKKALLTSSLMGLGVKTFPRQDMGLRGKTKEQKKIVKYFMSTGILGMIFRISDKTFDDVLDSKAQDVASGIINRALDTHGMDADEVKEIPPILAENYYMGSRYFKIFRDWTFRASEYQMTYLMFSDKQMYAYSYIFDLTSAETTEVTKEYFYEDITNIEVTKEQIEFPSPRPMEYIIGGIAGIIIGILLPGFFEGGGASLFFGLLILLAGIWVAFFVGYSRRIVDNLVLKLTVPGDEFICAVKPENIAEIQGMKAKIREKKK